MDLLALSFWQPWLWAIVEGHKGVTIAGRFYAIENRPWRPWPSVVGQRIALHASRTYDDEGLRFVADQLFEARAPIRLGVLNPTALPRGAIVGTGVVAGAVKVDEYVGSRQRAVLVPVLGRVAPAVVEAVLPSPWAFGPWCWLLTDIRKLHEPVPARGAQGLWKVPADVAARVRELEVADAR